MRTIDIEMNSSIFEYGEFKCDCSSVIKRDTKLIIKEAKESHGYEFSKLYNEKSLRPDKIRIWLDDQDIPEFGMIIFVIDYKTGSKGRYACGNYYPIYEGKMYSHPFQASICW